MSLISNNDTLYCVVEESIVVKSFNATNDQEMKVIRMGSLVVVQQILPQESVALCIFDSDADCGLDKVWVGKWKKLVPVHPTLWPAFQGISPFERIIIANDDDLCCELVKIKVGQMVKLYPDFQALPTSDHEQALVRYKGPVPEMGAGHYFGLEIVDHSKQGNCDGTICGKRYFTCTQDSGIFVSLNRLCPYRRAKHLSRKQVYSKPFKYSEVLTIPCPPMPSDEKRTHYNGGHPDSVNYTTTLVLHLKERENMPRNQPQKLERTEKLIDLEPSCNSSDASNLPLKIGDKVVWFNEREPEVGVVRWLGHLDSNTTDTMVGVECENPVGNGSGNHNGIQLFKTPMNHATFVPLVGLVKADDFFLKPGENLKKKVKNSKLIENCNHPKPNLYCNTRSQASNSRSVDCSRSEPFIWSNPLVEVDVSDNVRNDSYSNELINRDDNLCRSEYVFSEPNISTVPLKIESKRGVKDSKNNNISMRRGSSNMSNYPIDDVSPREYISIERHLIDRLPKNTKSSETKTRHSYSQDLHTPNDMDTCALLDNMWPSIDETTQTKNRTREDKCVKSTVGSTGKPIKLNNIAEPLLEIVNENLLAVAVQTKSNEVYDQLISTSPSSDGSGYCETSDSPERAVPSDLDVGSVVEVTVNHIPRYGVIRWIGAVPNDKKGRKVAGIEMEEEQVGHSDGTFNGRRYFQCNPRKALFVSLNQCQKDGRFQDVHPPSSDTKAKAFGQVDCPVIPGVVRPITCKGDLEVMCGKYRGIQGHHNSCYLDATLFSMFTFTSVFDSLLFRPPMESDVVHYEEVQRVLREEIVNPLRQNLYVRADRVMKLRTLLENLSSVTGLTSEEKDPEEFLTSLVAQILRAEPFLKLSSGQEAYHYQLFVEKDEQLILPSVQQLFDQSFLTSDIKLKEVPSCLIIQMPRFGKSFKMYPRILPSQLLDITDIIEDSPRQCTVCGKLAEYECKECFGQCGTGLESIAFCANCLETAHSHQRRSRHGWRRLAVPVEFSILQDHCHIPRLCMELFAVVCIETSHYVAFVKCGSGLDAPWCFFDSMADRKGEQNGYNIPEMVLCPKLPHWLSDEGACSLQEIKDDRLLPEHAKRLLCDAYMCMYQSPDVMMYR